MKLYFLKHMLVPVTLSMALPVVQAQFDDVYYDPDQPGAEMVYTYDTPLPDDTYDEDVMYYDNDEYQYYDDYDYYYTSRIRRFYRPYLGFDFYDPAYVSFNYYDPFFADSYYYPGTSIYLSFGSWDYWSYRQWRRWNRWNRWNNWNNWGHWNNWCLTPSSYYYNYNSWCAPGFNYWGGYHGYYGYSNYYNNYYNSCPYPVSHFNGITHTTITHINNGSTRGSYYGPRVTGTTGSSPRGPLGRPEYVQPVLGEHTADPATVVDRPSGQTESGRPGQVRVNDPVIPTPGTSDKPNSIPDTRGQQPGDVVKDIPVDRELKREDAPTGNKRPVFRPDPEKYQPYPTERTPSGTTPGTRNLPEYRPYTPDSRPTERPGTSPAERPGTRPGYTPSRGNDERPSYQPPVREPSEKPSYSPPTRETERPRYTPPQRTEPSRQPDRPAYTPPSRGNDRPSYSPPPRNDSQRSQDRPSYSPSSRSNSSSSGSSSKSSGGNSSSRSSSSSSSSSSSPRGRG